MWQSKSLDESVRRTPKASPLSTAFSHYLIISTGQCWVLFSFLSLYSTFVSVQSKQLVAFFNFANYFDSSAYIYIYIYACMYVCIQVYISVLDWTFLFQRCVQYFSICIILQRFYKEINLLSNHFILVWLLENLSFELLLGSKTLAFH